MPIEFRSDMPPVDQYYDLFLTTGWKFMRPITPELLVQTLENSWRRLFAYDGDRLVGAAHMCSDGGLHAIIYDVIVAPEYQGRGIGKQIMERMVQECLDAQIGTIQLFCAPGKQLFYEKLGFVVRPADGPGMQYRKR